MIPAVADADTLFGATTCCLLIHLDFQGLIRLHLSLLIVEELSRALVDTGRKPDLDSAPRAPHAVYIAAGRDPDAAGRRQVRTRGARDALHQ